MLPRRSQSASGSPCGAAQEGSSPPAPARLLRGPDVGSAPRFELLDLLEPALFAHPVIPGVFEFGLQEVSLARLVAGGSLDEPLPAECGESPPDLGEFEPAECVG